MSNENTVHDTYILGQSIWLDSITRSWIEDGELAQMVDELSIVGVTSNPTIFAGALATSKRYDADIRELSQRGLNEREIFTELAVNDIRGACDVLLPIYESSGHTDGMVSIEIEPDLAHNTEQSIARGRELWNLVGRPNCMIKVPATAEGLEVIETLLFEGINVNVTLLFSVAVYQTVIERYIHALERRVAAGLPVDAVRSVASFFVSRVDTAVDTILDGGSMQHPCNGKVAVANAVIAWETAAAAFGEDRWGKVAEHGGQIQRPLWASTGTKNPNYSDILYVQELIASGTVNTAPLPTIRAFLDHGTARVGFTDSHDARSVLEAIAVAGVNLNDVTRQLAVDGVASFEASFEELLDTIRTKAAALVGGTAS